MLESVIATMGWVVSNYLIAGVTPAAVGNENLTSAPSGTFAAANGPLNIAANKDEQWRQLAEHLGRADLLEHPDYRTREDRKAHRMALKAELESVLRTRPAEAWARELNALGVPAGAILTVPEVLAHPQIADRGLLADFAAVPGVDQDIQVVRTGVKLDGAAPAVDSPPPVLGQDNAEIYGDLGLDAAAREALAADGVI
ncbi:MAG: CoA transferase, partial [Pseudomonadota bacterium]|nr:CoA transferase [Pseudomonadota bacterium]